MSRIGKKIIELPKAVKCNIANGKVNVEGPKGKLGLNLSPRVQVLNIDGNIQVKPVANIKTDKAIQGTTRALIANMVKGVTEGYQKELLIEGVGFKAAIEGKKVNLALGFTHPVLLDIPEGLTVEIPKPTQIMIKGTDKALVGKFAADIRSVYPAEPYKGKGVRYTDEVVRRKAGKTVTK